MTHTGPFPQQRTDDDRCSNCVHFQPNDPLDIVGMCRRYPPTPTGCSGVPSQPTVETDDWCGEWQPREQGQS